MVKVEERSFTVGKRLWYEESQDKALKGEIVIPPMPEDFMPKIREGQGRPIKYDTDNHRKTREYNRRLYWKNKWKIHYLQQLLVDPLMDNAVRKHFAKKRKEKVNE